MPRRLKPSQRAAKQLAELAFAAPQVVLHRSARMAAAGQQPSAHDQAEFFRMGSEKVAAFYQSWIGMWTAAFTAQFALGRAFSSAALAMAAGRPASAAPLATLSHAAADIFAAGLAPVHKTATANARRIARRKR